MTDAQVADERFLVLINDLLASGEIQDLFPKDEVDNITSTLRSEVKAAGIVDTRDNCWKFFIDRVRRQLKVTPRKTCAPRPTRLKFTETVRAGRPLFLASG